MAKKAKVKKKKRVIELRKKSNKNEIDPMMMDDLDFRAWVIEQLGGKPTK